jgi:hypothetical protein
MVPCGASLNNYDEVRSGLSTHGWRLVSEDSVGATIRPQRRLRTLARVSLWIGLICLPALGLGLPLVLYAAIDYAASGLAPTLVVRRDAPLAPGRPSLKTPVLLCLTVILLMVPIITASLYCLLNVFGGIIGWLLNGGATKP